MIKRIVLAAALVAFLPGLANAQSEACENRVNNTVNNLLECVTLDGVRAHQSVLQSIADVNGGTRASGTLGYDESAMYVAEQMADAGYDVTLQPVMYEAFIQLGPSTLAQLAPADVSYVEELDYAIMSQSDPGDVTGLVTPVDLDLGPGNASTSGCEAADFAGFPPGNIALIQRGACSFGLKAENAAAAGAVGVIIFNQGNVPSRLGLSMARLGPATPVEFRWCFRPIYVARNGR